MKIENFVPSVFENRSPVRIGHGSLLPSEILRRLYFVSVEKNNKELSISAPIDIYKGYIGGSDYDYSRADPDRLFSRWIGKRSEDSIRFQLTAGNDPRVSIRLADGERILGEEITCVKRIENVLGVSKGRALSTGVYGALSVFTDFVPVWAEICTIAGVAASALDQRIRCLIEFEAAIEDTETAEKCDRKQPFLIADMPEMAFLLFDGCLHEPVWKRAAVAADVVEAVEQAPEVETDTSEASVVSEIKADEVPETESEAPEDADASEKDRTGSTG